MPPEAPTPAPAAPQKSFPVAGALAILVILIAIIAGVWYFVPGIGGKGNTVSGTLALYIQDSWTTPSGDTVSGLVAYDPSTGTATEMLPDFSGRAIPISVSPTGAHVLVLTAPAELAAANEGLFVVSTKDSTQQIPLLSATELQDESVASVAWDPQDRYIAVGLAPRIATTSVETKVFYLDYDYPTLSAGAGIPVAFSPSGDQLAIATGGTLSFRTATGTPQTIPNIAVSAHPTAAAASAESKYFLFYSPDGSQPGIHLYRAAWDQSSVADLGVLGDVAKRGYAFGPEGTLLAFDGKTFELMKDSGAAFTPDATVSLPKLPDNSALIGWYGFK